jgi:hypothetical protein
MTVMADHSESQALLAVSAIALDLNPPTGCWIDLSAQIWLKFKREP